MVKTLFINIFLSRSKMLRSLNDVFQPVLILCKNCMNMSFPGYQIGDYSSNFSAKNILLTFQME